MPQPRPTPRWKTPDGAVDIYCDDALGVLPKLPAESVDLVFADPPFNIDYGYDVYKDDLSSDEYLDWTGRWLTQVTRLTKPGAAVWVAIGVREQGRVRGLMDGLGLVWRNTVCWHYGFGPRQEGNFTPCWVALHYAVKPGTTPTWNPDTVRVASDRQTKYGDKRAVPGGKVPDNVWDVPRVCGTFRERTGHPCQMPLRVLDRVILSTSNPGDVVLDPFLGSGTTAESALRNGRRCTGVELSPAYVDEYCAPRLYKAFEEHAYRLRAANDLPTGLFG